MILAAGYLIFRESPAKQFLLMRHRDRWDLPKGHVDPGETILQAAQRELFEETGISMPEISHDGGFRFEHEYSPGGDSQRRKQLTIFLGHLQEAVEIVPTEHEGFEWFDWNPPHQIQRQTIDPLLARVAEYIAGSDH